MWLKRSIRSFDSRKEEAFSHCLAVGFHLLDNDEGALEIELAGYMHGECIERHSRYGDELRSRLLFVILIVECAVSSIRCTVCCVIVLQATTCRSNRSWIDRAPFCCVNAGNVCNSFCIGRIHLKPSVNQIVVFVDLLSIVQQLASALDIGQ